MAAFTTDKITTSSPNYTSTMTTTTPTATVCPTGSVIAGGGGGGDDMDKESQDRSSPTESSSTPGNFTITTTTTSTTTSSTSPAKVMTSMLLDSSSGCQSINAGATSASGNTSRGELKGSPTSPLTPQSSSKSHSTLFENRNSSSNNNVVNSRSVSLASVSSEGSTESHVVEQEEMEALTKDVRDLKEAIGRLQKTFNPEASDLEGMKVASHERLSDMLKVLRQMLEKYPLLQSNDLVESASHLIYLVKEFNFEEQDIKIFENALDILAQSVRNRVTEYLSGDLDSNISVSSSNKTKSCENLLGSEFVDIMGNNGVMATLEDTLNPEQIDGLLMRHEQGVDHALARAKIWSKYAKDVMTYVEKRVSFETEFSRNLTKLAQQMRPTLKEESYLPFQSIYCTALDQDLEMCTATQTTCRHLQGSKFMEPLQLRRSEHEKTRKNLKDRWYKELKKMHDAVNNLRKAKTNYMHRTQEYQRCREAVRIAEQGAEIGATGEKKVDKSKINEKEALSKMSEAEAAYKNSVDEANERHRKLLEVKAESLKNIRELIYQCDQTMKAVTVAYFQLQHSQLANVPIQFQTLCESSRLYEPGSQFMEYVKRLPEPTSIRFSSPDPFTFEAYSEDQVLMLDKQRKPSNDVHSSGVDHSSTFVATYKMKSSCKIAWAGPGQPSDTESVESGKSQETSPSASPMIPGRNLLPSNTTGISSSDNEQETDKFVSGHDISYGTNTINSVENRGHQQFLKYSRAASTHQFKKLKTFSKCRECDSFLFQGYECSECGLSVHKKCLETLAIQCGHKRLLRKFTTFGVDLSQHLFETGAQVPPLVIKCVHEIDSRGICTKGIYRVSSVKSKVERLCMSFESAVELVELAEFQPVVIANALKYYIRLLPEPLLTVKLYPEFINIGKNYPASSSSNDRVAINELKTLIKNLPRAHYLTTANLMHHLRRVANNSSTNNMPASNLAIIFGPNLLRMPETKSTDLSDISDTMYQSRAVELLIIHSLEIFGPEDQVRPKDYLKYISPPSLENTSSRTNNRNRLSRSNDIFSSQTERREISNDEISIPGLVVEHNPILAELIASRITTNSDDDDTDIPDFLLPDSSSKSNKSPMIGRGSSPPKIITQSLKNFSGLESFSPATLSTQDSLEVAQRLSKSSSTASSIDHSISSPGTTTSGGGGILVKQKSAILPHEAPNYDPNTSIFAKMGKAAKKHSLDEDHLSTDHISHLLTHHKAIDQVDDPSVKLKSTPPMSMQQVPILRSYQSPSSGRSSLNIDINSSTPATTASSVPSRSCSLSDDAHFIAAEQRRKLQAMSAPSTATIVNIEENKVKIQVPGLLKQSTLQSKIVKQSSIDKGDG